MRVRHRYLWLLVLTSTGAVFYLWANSTESSRSTYRQNNHNEKTCYPKKRLLFVKTHKTGSTTLINVFQRYAYRRRLTVALPLRDDIFLGWPWLLTNLTETVLRQRDSTYTADFIINHLVYNESLIRPLMKPGTVRVSLVREPIAQLRSSFNYFDILKSKDLNADVVEAMIMFADNPKRFDASYRMPNWFVQSHTKNPQLADLGLEFRHMNSQKKVENYVEYILSEMDIMMVVELMDESLLLLKRLMCWELDDIFYQNKYMLPYPGKTRPVPQQTIQRLQMWNNGDTILYTRARQKLLQRIQSEENFMSELTHFRHINSLVQTHCAEVGSECLVIQGSRWNREITVCKDLCEQISRSERKFTRMLQHRQRPDIFSEKYTNI